MTVEYLINILEKLPLNAIVYVEADHGQQPEQAGFISLTKDEELEYYGEDMGWRDLSKVRKKDQVTAVLIGA